MTSSAKQTFLYIILVLAALATPYVTADDSELVKTLNRSALLKEPLGLELIAYGQKVTLYGQVLLAGRDPYRDMVVFQDMHDNIHFFKADPAKVKVDATITKSPPPTYFPIDHFIDADNLNPAEIENLSDWMKSRAPEIRKRFTNSAVSIEKWKNAINVTAAVGGTGLGFLYLMFLDVVGPMYIGDLGIKSVTDHVSSFAPSLTGAALFNQLSNNAPLWKGRAVRVTGAILLTLFHVVLELPHVENPEQSVDMVFDVVDFYVGTITAFAVIGVHEVFNKVQSFRKKTLKRWRTNTPIQACPVG